MITENVNPASQTGEDQASSEFASRWAHWGRVQSGLVEVVKTQGWSTTQEKFDAETLSNLILANDYLRAGDVVYSADNKALKLSDLITTDDIIPIMAARAKALAGEEMAAGYPDVSNLHKRILDGALRGWMSLCCAPEFFGVENIQPYKVTDLDLDAAARVVIGGAA